MQMPCFSNGWGPLQAGLCAGHTWLMSGTVAALGTTAAVQLLQGMGGSCTSCPEALRARCHGSSCQAWMSMQPMCLLHRRAHAGVK